MELIVKEVSHPLYQKFQEINKAKPKFIKLYSHSHIRGGCMQFYAIRNQIEFYGYNYHKNQQCKKIRYYTAKVTFICIKGVKECTNFIHKKKYIKSIYHNN